MDFAPLPTPTSYTEHLFLIEPKTKIIVNWDFSMDDGEQ